MESGASVRAVDRAAAILAAFSVDRPEVSLTDLAKVAGVAPSTTHRLLASLANNHLIERSDDQRLYRLGPAAVALGATAMWNHDPAEEIRQVMSELRDETEESVGLSRRTGDNATVIARAQSRLPLAANSNVGTVFAGHATSAGRMLLSYQPDEVLRRKFHQMELERFTRNTPGRIEDVLPLLQEARDNGFATEREHYALGLTCIAVPIPVASGKPYMTLGVSASTGRWDPQALIDVAPVLKKAAGRIASINIGGVVDS